MTPRPVRTITACLRPVRIHAVAARVKGADDKSVFAIKTATKNVTITQVQPTNKGFPAKAKKNQAETINLQLNIRRRSSAPLKTKQQAIKATLRNNGSKCRRKKNASSTPATDVQEKVITPNTLLRGRGGRHQRCTMTTTVRRARSTTTARRAWSTTTTTAASTTTASHTSSAFRHHEKRKRKASKM